MVCGVSLDDVTVVESERPPPSLSWILERFLRASPARPAIAASPPAPLAALPPPRLAALPPPRAPLRFFSRLPVPEAPLDFDFDCPPPSGSRSSSEEFEPDGLRPVDGRRPAWVAERPKRPAGADLDWLRVKRPDVAALPPWRDGRVRAEGGRWVVRPGMVILLDWVN